jgi:Mycothiol maleylpyruvate isomerase N-terminal domain
MTPDPRSPSDRGDDVTDNTTEPSFEDVLAVLRRSHDRFAGAIGSLGEDELRRQSYDDDWSIAQVAGHLGSGVEIFGLYFDAGFQQEPLPGLERFQPVWDTWNAKSHEEQARDALHADAAFLDRMDALTSASTCSAPSRLPRAFFGCACPSTPCIPGTSSWRSIRPRPSPRRPSS